MMTIKTTQTFILENCLSVVKNRFFKLLFYTE